MEKVTKIKIKRETIEPKFEIDEVVMLKENLFPVVVKHIKTKRNRYIYFVKYNHLPDGLLFKVEEDELADLPMNYDEIIFKAYVEYRYKYESMMRDLFKPASSSKYKSRPIKY